MHILEGFNGDLGKDPCNGVLDGFNVPKTDFFQDSLDPREEKEVCQSHVRTVGGIGAALPIVCRLVLTEHCCGGAPR